MAKCHPFRNRHLHKLAIGALMLVPATTMAETYNMPQFGRVEKQVTETIDFYDLKGTGEISSSSSNNSFATVVFTPANPGEAVQITFSRIHLKGDGKSYPVSLSIFDGNYDEDVTYPTTTSSVSATDFPDNGRLLKRYYSEADKTLLEDSNVTFTSSDPDGSLSVCFLYKYAAKCDGWEAKVNSVTLTDQEILSATPDYSGVNPQTYGGLKGLTLGSLNLTTSGILNPFSATSISFDLDDPEGILENITLLANGSPVDAEPVISGNTYTYPLARTLVPGDNLFTVKADTKAAAPFYASASLRFTDIATNAPSTPAIEATDPVAVTVAAMVMMPSDGSHITASVEEGKSILFYDNGGPSANYPEQTSGTVTFKPAEGSQGKVMLDFSAIDLFNTNPAKNDQLIVYDGTEVNPDRILVTLLKQTKALVRSTSEDGALTVSFATTTGVTKSGWEATASLFTPQPMTLSGTDVAAASSETLASGDTDCPILRILVKTANTEPPLTLSGVKLDFDGTEAQWSKAKAYYTRNTSSFDPASAILVGETAVNSTSTEITAAAPVSLLEGDNYLWIVADVNPEAASGSRVDATATALLLGGETVEVSPASGSTGREVYNLVTLSDSHPVKAVYGSINMAHEPYSTYYPGYDGVNKNKYATFIPGHEGHICQIDFSKLNLYFYKSSYSSSMDVTPKFEIYSGTEATGEPIYVHTQDNNLKSGDDPSAIGTIRSTSPDGALTILFNATTSNSTSTSKGADYGIAAIVSEYQSKPMTLTSARGISSGLEAVAISSAVNVPAVGLVVTTDGDSSPLTLDNVTFGIKADASVYTAVKLAASGKRASYKDAEVIATGEITPEGEVTFTPAIPLAEGENHFWLLGDISPEAAPATIIDAKINTLTINGEPATVDNADPEGEILTVNTYDPILGDKEQVVEVGQYPVLINGVTAAYMTNEYTITAKPAAQGGKVTATFTEGAFNVNTSNQYITVIGGAEAFGVDYNTVYPVSVTSAREDGQLIIEYHSMTIAKPEGWKCTLSCDSRKPFTMDDFEVLPATTDCATRGSEVLLSGVKFEVTGDKDDISLSAFVFDIPDAADIFSELRLYATGDGPEFLRDNLIATTDATTASLMPTEPFLISAAGTYHFWLQGVVKADAAINASTTVSPVSLDYSVGETAGSADLTSLESHTFTVVEGFHGTYRIGSSIDARYPDFASALNAMAAGIEGPVKFIVEPGTYNERVELDHIQGASSTNTITFEGETGDPGDVILVSNQWSEPPYSDDKLEYYYGVATLRGTSNVTFRAMTIRTTNVQMPSVIHIAGGSSDVTIESCVVSAPTSNTTYNNLTLVNSYVGPSATSVNNRLSVIDSDLVGGYCGIKFGSSTISQPESEGITVTGCSFREQGYQAIYLYFAKDATIADNSLRGTAATDGKNYCQMIDLDISGPAVIERNILEYSKTGTYGLYLRRLAGSDEAPILIANNILDINVGSKPGAAIQLYNSASKPYTGFVMAHNTVRTSGSDIVMPLIINVKTGTTVDGIIANNIFQNTVATYVIKEQYGPSGATYLNNAGYTSDPTYAYWGGSYDQKMTWNQWAIASGETGGVNQPVSFDSSDETRPLWPASFSALKAGTPLPQVTTDFLGIARDTEVPTIGAYEHFTSGIESTESDRFQNEGNTLSASDMLTVEADNEELRVYTLSGVMLMQTRVNGRVDIPVGHLPRGLFLMTVGSRASRLLLH
ncbi:MAG: right-handed parallel beta-helix repeat-containing protein [Muribaculaceae bacterium]|nr:right-handed parallel beta-helix repeat-containing protein [Muribaculaceae bacterium]